MSRALPASVRELLRPLLSSAQAAEFLGISEDTLRDIRAAGDITYVNIGRVEIVSDGKDDEIREAR